jgi:DNA polymerase-3 subunit epsilon
MEDYAVLDIETTGLQIPENCGACSVQGVSPQCQDPSFDEILQIAIIDNDGIVLFHDSFKPEISSAWPVAQDIHHISPEDVAKKLPFSARLEEVQSIINRVPFLVAYNIAFDLGFLQGSGISLNRKPCVCVMEVFARMFGRRRRYGNGHQWQSLTSCAAYFGLVNERPHDALSDARLTLACFKAMANDKRFHVQPEPWGAKGHD